MADFYRGEFDPAAHGDIFHVNNPKENKKEQKRKIAQARKRKHGHWFRYKFNGQHGSHASGNKPHQHHESHHTLFIKICLAVFLLIVIVIGVIFVGDRVKYHRDAPSTGESQYQQSRVYKTPKHNKKGQKIIIKKVIKKPKHLSKFEKAKLRKKARAKARQKRIQKAIAKRNKDKKKAAEAKSKMAQQEFNSELAKMNKANGTSSSNNKGSIQKQAKNYRKNKSNKAKNKKAKNNRVNSRKGINNEQ